MRSQSQRCDMKRAASGDREEAAMPVGPQESLSAALKRSSTTIRTANINKELVKPLNNYPVSEGVVDPNSPRYIKMMKTYNHEPTEWLSTDSYHLQPQKEIVAAFSRFEVSGATNISTGTVQYNELNRNKEEAMFRPFRMGTAGKVLYQPLVQMHKRIHLLTFDASLLITENGDPYKGICIVVGFYSRNKQPDNFENIHNDSRGYLDYIGLTKVLVSPADNGVSIYLDLTDLKR